jgi:hypothetical protein
LLALSAGHASFAYASAIGTAAPPGGLLPYTLPGAALLGSFASAASGLSDVVARYPGASGGAWYGRCVGLWRVELALPELVTLRISHPAGQPTQVTVGEVTLHSAPGEGAPEGAGGQVAVTRQLLLVPGTYLVDVLARPAAGADSVSYSVSVELPQQGAIDGKAWLSLVAR